VIAGRAAPKERRSNVFEQGFQPKRINTEQFSGGAQTLGCRSGPLGGKRAFGFMTKISGGDRPPRPGGKPFGPRRKALRALAAKTEAIEGLSTLEQRSSRLGKTRGPKLITVCNWLNYRRRPRGTATGCCGARITSRNGQRTKVELRYLFGFALGLSQGRSGRRAIDTHLRSRLAARKVFLFHVVATLFALGRRGNTSGKHTRRAGEIRLEGEFKSITHPNERPAMPEIFFAPAWLSVKPAGTQNPRRMNAAMEREPGAATGQVWPQWYFAIGQRIAFGRKQEGEKQISLCSNGLGMWSFRLPRSLGGGDSRQLGRTAQLAKPLGRQPDCGGGRLARKT